MLLLATSKGKSTTNDGIIPDGLDEHKIIDRELLQEGIERIAETYKGFKEDEKFSRLVEKDEIVKNDYNISPSRYIQVNDAYIYRPIEEIVDELREQESEYAIIDAEVKNILDKLGV